MENKINLLIVDDVYTNRYILKAMTKHICKNTIEAENGQDAIKALEKEDIDLILLDIEMPVMNGIEVIKHVRSKMIYPKNKVPIIVVTGNDIYELKNNNPGFNHIVGKPVSTGQLLGLIETVKNNISLIRSISKN